MSVSKMASDKEGPASAKAPDHCSSLDVTAGMAEDTLFCEAMPATPPPAAASVLLCESNTSADDTAEEDAACGGDLVAKTCSAAPFWLVILWRK